ncbi:MAG TPA: polysaccharide pyruvyl transferase family protein [Hyphomonadaceae bacterium]|nr:polysaccharide pyruvyl transferase family protein [Hyphomonadaceae bacterium]
MRILAPFGFYGSGNIGDEATLVGFGELVRAFASRFDTSIASVSPSHTARVEPYFRYHRYKGGFVGLRSKLTAHHARALVFPGGTPIQDSLGSWPLDQVAPMVEYGHKWGKAAVFLGVGVEGLARNESREIMRSRIIPRVAYWTVRSSMDQQRLLDYGAPADRVTVAADMAWLIRKAGPTFGQEVLQPHLASGRPLIAVNINAETEMLERAPALLQNLARALDALIDRHDARVIFFFNETRQDPTYDIAAAKQLTGMMRRADEVFAVPETYFSPMQVMSILGNCALVISTRYHACIFSALQGKPFVALKRSDKLFDLCSDLQWTHGVAVEAATDVEIADQADALLSSPQNAISHLAAKVDGMRVRARKNLKGLEELRAATGSSYGLLHAVNNALRLGSKPA